MPLYRPFLQDIFHEKNIVSVLIRLERSTSAATTTTISSVIAANIILVEIIRSLSHYHRHRHIYSYLFFFKSSVCTLFTYEFLKQKLIVVAESVTTMNVKLPERVNQCGQCKSDSSESHLMLLTWSRWMWSTRQVDIYTRWRTRQWSRASAGIGGPLISVGTEREKIDLYTCVQYMLRTINPEHTESPLA